MSREFHTIAQRALELDPADRLRLAAELLASVEGRADPAWSAAWKEEIDARLQAADAREVRGTPWSDVRAHVLNKLAQR